MVWGTENEQRAIFRVGNFKVSKRHVTHDFIVTLSLIRFFEFEISTKVSYPAGIYLLKVNNRNSRTRCEICSKLIMVSLCCLYC